MGKLKFRVKHRGKQDDKKDCEFLISFVLEF